MVGLLLGGLAPKLGHYVLAYQRVNWLGCDRHAGKRCSKCSANEDVRRTTQRLYSDRFLPVQHNRNFKKENGPMMTKYGLGWLPDVPSVNDYTAGHEEVAPILARASSAPALVTTPKSSGIAG